MQHIEKTIQKYKSVEGISLIVVMRGQGRPSLTRVEEWGWGRGGLGTTVLIEDRLVQENRGGVSLSPSDGMTTLGLFPQGPQLERAEERSNAYYTESGCGLGLPRT